MNITINGPVSNTNWAIDNEDVTQSLMQVDFKNEIQEAASKFREELTAARDAFLSENFPDWQRRTRPSVSAATEYVTRVAVPPTEKQIEAVYEGVRSALATLRNELPEMRLGSRADGEIRRTVAEINDELGRASRDRARVGAGLEKIITVLQESRSPEDASAGERASAAAERLKTERLRLDTLDVA
ncbi:hypothetical protein ACFWPQ_19885 [Streptomyces sp. NPDC058464]|uniref:hypothetical protein n=1 Tax=Streptomyces sp. NPDC058464 TaxID=3346511 RepID=UPI00364E2E4A